MTHETEQVLRDYFELITAGDIAGAWALYADDVVLHVPGQHLLSGDYHGRDDVTAFNGKVREMTNSTFRLTPHDLLGSANHAVMLADVSAERNGTVLEWRRVSISHVSEGKITEIWFHESDQAGVDELFS